MLLEKMVLMRWFARRNAAETNRQRRARENAEALASSPFQSRVQPWMLECFGAEIAVDTFERNHRFFEEAAELVQAVA
jgi:hypothetical protein